MGVVETTRLLRTLHVAIEGLAAGGQRSRLPLVNEEERVTEKSGYGYR